MLNEIGKKLFEQIFGHTLEKLANKLINTINKENQIIVKNIQSMIQSNSPHVNLDDAIKLILDLSKTI